MIDNFDVELVLYANGVRNLPWEWGVTDCGIITRNALTLVHDRDVWAGVVGNWTTAKGAKRALKSLNNWETVIADTGGRSVAPNWQRTGDMVLGIDSGHDDMPQLAIILPAGQVLMSTKSRGVHVLRHYTQLIDVTFWRWSDRVS